MSSIVLSDGYREGDFEADGSLRDICVLGADMSVWRRLVDAVASGSWNYQFEYNERCLGIERFSMENFFATKDLDLEISARLSIRVGEIWFDCFFFELREIEFSFDPSELRGGGEFRSLEMFMIWLAKICERRAILTMETSRHSDIPPLLETQISHEIGEITSRWPT